MIKTYRTVEDVLKSALAQPGALKEIHTQGVDRVLRSTRLEDSIYADLRNGDDAMDAIEQDAVSKLKSFPALSRDVYQSFYSLSPRRNDESILSPTARKFNAQILSHVTEQDDYPALKNICEGRDLLSYEAASEFISRTAGELDDLLSELGGDKGTLQTLEKLENSKAQAEENLSELLRRYARSGGKDAALERALISAANLLDSKSRQAEAVARIADVALLRNRQHTDELISFAVQAAKDKAEEVQGIIGAWSDEPGDLTRRPMNLELLSRVRKSEALLAISKHLGRFREIFAQGKKNGYAYGRGENYSLELGCDLSRAISSELAMLATPETVPLFLRKYRDKRIKQYMRREPVYKGMGDIICCRATRS